MTDIGNNINNIKPRCRKPCIIVVIAIFTIIISSMVSILFFKYPHKFQIGLFGVEALLLATIIGGIFIWLLVKHLIIDDLEKTTEVINMIADGNFKLTLPNDKYVVINKLNMAINRLAKQTGARTSQLNTEIQNHIEATENLILTKQELKNRVDKRTVNLAITNDLLQDEIIERKKTETALRRAKEEAEKANKSKSTFIANMSHELRTPMNAIIGISKMITKQNGHNLTKRQKEGLSIINRSGKRLLLLINEILDLSKIEAGKMQVNIEIMSVKDMMVSIHETVSALIKDKNISFSYNIDKSVPNIISSDQQKLNQILLNLLGNAVKFTNKGKIQVNVIMGQTNIKFEVSDTGIGIAENNLSLIFDKFNQADESITKKYAGTGLGLTLCKEYVELLKGEIHISSVLKKGTTIHFHIPVISELKPT
jgi:signal transduction histidine kinase